MHTFRRAPTIFNLLRNDKSIRSNDFKSGVYKIPVQNFEDNRTKTYIGATARNFKERLTEHKENISKRNLNTALAVRVYEKDTKVLWQNARVIKNIQDHKALPIAEKIEILKNSQKENVVNIRQADNLSIAWKYAIHNSN